MSLKLKQKIHIKAIFGNIGLFLYIPALMAFISIAISLVFKEYFAILPLLIIGTVNLAVAFILHKFCFEPQKVHLWDAMISIALSWFFCAIFGAIKYFVLAKIAILSNISVDSVYLLSKPINAVFESFSGFTSSGLTMLQKVEDLPKTIQWLRSFQQWIGGVGLIIFVLSLIEPKSEEYQLYFAETKSKGFNKSLINTTRSIIFIYSIFTILGILLFALAKMGIWASINHAMSAIATGGFTITDNSFMGYSFIIKIIAIFLMILGAMSFTLHHKIFVQRKFLEFFKNIQNRVFFILLIVGSSLIILINFKSNHFINYIFQWVSSLATCGFSSQKIANLLPSTKFLMIIAMIIGGCSGSTVGGLKIRRVIFLFQSISLRVVSFTLLKEKKILTKKRQPKKEEPSGVYLPESQKTERLYEASVLFFLWIFTLFAGVFLLLLLEPEKKIIDIFFDVTSAMSNVGLSTGVTIDSLKDFSKIIFILLMWIGRLEIIPILVLFISFFYSCPKKSFQKK